MLHSGDTVAHRVRHVTPIKGLDVAAVEESMLQRMPARVLLASCQRSLRMPDRSALAKQQWLENHVQSCLPSRQAYMRSMEQLCMETLQHNRNSLLQGHPGSAYSVWNEAQDLIQVSPPGDDSVLRLLSGSPKLDEWCIRQPMPRWILLQALIDASQQYRCCSAAHLTSLQSFLICMHHGILGAKDHITELSSNTVLLSPVKFSNFKTDVVELVSNVIDAEVLRAEAEREDNKRLAAERAEKAKEAAAAELAQQQQEGAKAGKGQKPSKSRAPSRGASTPAPASGKGGKGGKQIALVPENSELAIEEEPMSLPIRKVLRGCDMGTDEVVQVAEKRHIVLVDDVDCVCIDRESFDGGDCRFRVTVYDGSNSFTLQRLVSASQMAQVENGTNSTTQAVDHQPVTAPATEAAEEGLEEQPEKDTILSDFESLPTFPKASCVFSSYQAEVGGMQIAGSWFKGGRPESIDDDFAEQLASATKELQSIPEIPLAVASPDKSSKGGGKKAQQQQAEAERLEAQRKANEELRESLALKRRDLLHKARELRLRPKFPHTSVTLPNGLMVAFSVNHTTPVLGEHSRAEPGHIVVKQGHPTPPSTTQSQTERFHSQQATTEEARFTHPDGTVTVLNRDGDCKVLFADGSTAKGQLLQSKQDLADEQGSSKHAVSGASTGDIKSADPAGLTRAWTWTDNHGCTFSWSPQGSPSPGSAPDVDVSKDPQTGEVSTDSGKGCSQLWYYSSFCMANLGKVAVFYASDHASHMHSNLVHS